MIFARLTEQGTAAPETAVCEEHRDLSPFGEADVTFDPPVDCTGNDELECVVCPQGRPHDFAGNGVCNRCQMCRNQSYGVPCRG